MGSASPTKAVATGKGFTPHQRPRDKHCVHVRTRNATSVTGSAAGKVKCTIEPKFVSWKHAPCAESADKSIKLRKSAYCGAVTIGCPQAFYLLLWAKGFAKISDANFRS